MLTARLTPAHCQPAAGRERQSGRSSGVEHNLAKVGVEGSNPFARSSSFTGTEFAYVGANQPSFSSNNTNQ